MIRIISCLFGDTDTCRQIFEIRRLVFVEEQQVSREEEFDAFEKSSLHYLGLLNNQPAGTARWRVTADGIKLERFAVLKELRNKGVAAAVLSKVLADIAPLEQRIYLNAQLTAVKFYEKYGFEKVGEIFTEANIEHYKMYFKNG
jgi:predicted GNAT family N-acyltransferase